MVFQFFFIAFILSQDQFLIAVRFGVGFFAS